MFPSNTQSLLYVPTPKGVGGNQSDNHTTPIPSPPSPRPSSRLELCRARDNPPNHPSAGVCYLSSGAVFPTSSRDLPLLQHDASAGELLLLPALSSRDLGALLRTHAQRDESRVRKNVEGSQNVRVGYPRRGWIGASVRPAGPTSRHLPSTSQTQLLAVF